MELNLHANATTTPKVRAYIQRSKKKIAELASELGVSRPQSGGGAPVLRSAIVRIRQKKADDQPLADGGGARLRAADAAAVAT